MTRFEYTVIPAPSRGEKIRGAKSPAERFAAALATAINDMAAEGWDYLRAETLPTEERHGLTGRAITYHNVLVFRRPLAAATPLPQIERSPVEATATATPPEDSPRRPPEADFPARPPLAAPASGPATASAPAPLTQNDSAATTARPPARQPENTQTDAAKPDPSKPEAPRPTRLGPALK